MIKCATCPDEWDETDMTYIEDEGYFCDECHDTYTDSLMPAMSEMRAFTRSTARPLCSGCDNRHDRGNCPIYGPRG